MSLEKALGFLVREEKNKLIEEFLVDLISVNAPYKAYPNDPLYDLIKKWQGRLKEWI